MKIWLLIIAIAILFPGSLSYAAPTGIVIGGGGGGSSVADCKEHSVTYIETAAVHAHSVIIGTGAQLENDVTDFVITASSVGWGNCWEWDPDPNKTGIQYNAAAAGCTQPSPVNIRFEFQVSGYSSVADSALGITATTSLVAGNLTLFSGIRGTTSQSAATSINSAGKYFGLSSMGVFEGEVVTGKRLALTAQAAAGGAFTFSTNASIRMTVKTMSCLAP